MVLAVLEETAPRLLEHFGWLASHADFVRDFPHLFFKLVVYRIQKLVSHHDELEQAETEQQQRQRDPKPQCELPPNGEAIHGSFPNRYPRPRTV